MAAPIPPTKKTRQRLAAEAGKKAENFEGDVAVITGCSTPDRRNKLPLNKTSPEKDFPFTRQGSLTPKGFLS
jgi:hypothetical protein